MNEYLDMNNVGMGGKDETNSILWDYSAENIKVNTFFFFLTLISLQPDDVHFWFLKIGLFDLNL